MISAVEVPVAIADESIAEEVASGSKTWTPRVWALVEEAALEDGEDAVVTAFAFASVVLVDEAFDEGEGDKEDAGPEDDDEKDGVELAAAGEKVTVAELELEVASSEAVVVGAAEENPTVVETSLELTSVSVAMAVLVVVVAEGTDAEDELTKRSSGAD